MANRYYERPSPHSFGDTGTLMRSMKDDKDRFKAEELQKELRQEDRENADNS